jgi:ferric-dicitrate binding protein FerR (iron transport regulator)
VRHPDVELERLASHGLPAVREAALREHLRQCERCRARYDHDLLLRRALSGRGLHEPLEAEVEGTLQRVLHDLALREQRDEEAAPEPAPRSWWAWGMASAAAAFVAVVGVTAVLMLPPDSVGELQQADGVAVAGRRVSRGHALAPGDHIVVNTKGMAVVRLPSVDATLRAFPGTELVMESNDASSVRLVRGKVWTQIARLPAGRAFQIRTRDAVALVRGTSFVVEQKEEATDVRVLGGAVALTDARGERTVTIPAAHRASVAAGYFPTVPRSYEPTEDIDAWRGVLVGFVNELQRAIKLGIDELEALLP